MKIYFFLILLSISLLGSTVSAETFGYGRTEETPINYSLIPTVNSSDYWDNLDTPADITYDDLSAGDVNALGYTGTFNFLTGVVGTLSMTGDPWYLGGTDLEIAEDLIVDKDIRGLGVGSYFNQTLQIDGNIADSDATLVIRSDINLHSCINLTEGTGSLGFSICNDGSGTNRLVFANLHDGYEWMWIDRDDGTINFLNITEVHSNLTAEYFIGDGSRLTNLSNAGLWESSGGASQLITPEDINLQEQSLLNITNITIINSIKDSDSESKMYFDDDGAFVIEA